MSDEREELHTWVGFLYLSVVMDVWSRRIVGGTMAPHLRTKLALAALDMAVEQRRPVDVIHHSDLDAFTHVDLFADVFVCAILYDDLSNSF